MAITRARQSMTVVSSFTHHDFDLGKLRATRNRGPEMLRAFLEYCSHGGDLHRTGTARTDWNLNGFEQQVLAALGQMVLARDASRQADHVPPTPEPEPAPRPAAPPPAADTRGPRPVLPDYTDTDLLNLATWLLSDGLQPASPRHGPSVVADTAFSQGMAAGSSG
ncbi:hypothetical protein [Streptomyces sp. NPDC048581]|uniref:hypothetical protein n=1 Tax=unclassified Streptomyces TaxID=2593676 RepID=UPI0037231F9C